MVYTPRALRALGCRAHKELLLIYYYLHTPLSLDRTGVSPSLFLSPLFSLPQLSVHSSLVTTKVCPETKFMAPYGTINTCYSCMLFQRSGNETTYAWRLKE